MIFWHAEPSGRTRDPMLPRPDVQHVGPARTFLFFTMLPLFINLLIIQILEQLMDIQLGRLAQRHRVILIGKERIWNMVVRELDVWKWPPRIWQSVWSI